MLNMRTWADAENKRIRQVLIKTDDHGGFMTIGGKDIIFDLAGDKLNFYVAIEDTDIQPEIPDLVVELDKTHSKPGTKVCLTRSINDEETACGDFLKGTTGVLVDEDGDTLFRPDGYGDGWGFYLSADDYEVV